jgi:hypothetical protein
MTNVAEMWNYIHAGVEDLAFFGVGAVLGTLDEVSYRRSNRRADEEDLRESLRDEDSVVLGSMHDRRVGNKAERRRWGDTKIILPPAMGAVSGILYSEMSTTNGSKGVEVAGGSVSMTAGYFTARGIGALFYRDNSPEAKKVRELDRIERIVLDARRPPSED